MSNNEFYDGIINGAFLSLIILVFTGFTLGILLFVFMSVYTAMMSSLSSLAPAATQTTTSQGNVTYYNWINLIESIVFIIGFFFAGMLGGAFGTFLKQGINKLRRK